jgi:hypothetical protein
MSLRSVGRAPETSEHDKRKHSKYFFIVLKLVVTKLRFFSQLQAKRRTKSGVVKKKMGPERGQWNVNGRYLLLVSDERAGRQRPTCVDKNYLPVVVLTKEQKGKNQHALMRNTCLLVFLTYSINHKGKQEGFEE